MPISVAQKIWPKWFLPGVRKDAAFLFLRLSKLTNQFQFFVWRTYSRFVFGSSRWISVYGFSKIKVYTQDYRGFLVWRSHGTQKEKISVWQSMAAGDPDLCLDLGANYGEFSCSISNKVRKLVAVEANPNLIPLLRESFEGARNIVVLHGAVNELDGNLQFFFNTSASGSASLSQDVVLSERNAAWSSKVEASTVPAFRVDTIVKMHLPTAQSLLIKADVEGFEDQVVRSAEPILNQLEWWRMLLEFNPNALEKSGKNVNDLWKYLRKFQGIVIFPQTPVSGDEVKVLPNLTSEVPIESCEIIIGDGVIPEFGR